MLKQLNLPLLLVIILAVTISACKKKKETATEEEPAATTTTGTVVDPGNSVSMNITNCWANQIIQLSPIGPYTAATPKYVNANNDTCSISQCRYYISNIRLKRSDNTYYSETESYHLIEQMDTSNTCKFNLAGVPAGSYTQLEFLIGVDSTRNCSGAKTGALDPVHGMFWSWAQGYIFMQFEGYSNQSTASTSDNLVYHLGGFSAPYNNIKKVTIPLNTNLTVVSDHVSKLYLKADISETFKTPVTLNFAVDKSAMQAAPAKKYADNYADMFSLRAVIN